MTSHQHHPGELDHPAEDRAPRGEDLAALLDRLLGEVPDKTQKDLAAAANISYPTLNAWMNRNRGTSRIAPDTLRAMVDVFRSWGVDVTPAEMFASVGRAVPGSSDSAREARLLKLYRQLPKDKQRDLIKDAEAMLRISRVP
ncbi:helix-turn-helix transcriptional regulator [Streptomyces sp. CC224B]|uniref:helix-turn-helix domain-containing protein n=1 Tax=Streptomyces sp. CC224B TaxID=3044571 RepID=UPI0024A7BE4A|nr:helix-turn-helix transcriptional regulator [Streptomyces sp. CC224B]